MLKSLEMYGFKSFADRTRFDFSAGITGVVGPNGSGKSNVVDALKWILGDQSAKSLRGKDMTDVIFNGSASRKPCSYAEAFLTIDNSRKILAVDDAEVVIGRRLYRSGDAEYLVNRQPARLKDIRDLLLGTGAGNAAYSIIEQGRVDQILQSNPAARRSVFEEAAGISRFKARRVEAQRKLERVAQNLQRLSDIVDEVEARLNTTRGQAAKAVKYRELSRELKDWWLGLAADDSRHATAELDEISQRLEALQKRLQELAEDQKACDASEAVFDQQLSEIEQHLRVAERAVAQHRETLASLEASSRFQNGRLQELDADLVRQRENHRLLQGREREGRAAIRIEEDRLAELITHTDHLKTQLSVGDGQVQQAAQELTEAQERLEKRRQAHQAIQQQLISAEQGLAALMSRFESVSQSQAELQQRWIDVGHELELAESLREELLRDYETRQQHVVELQSIYRQRQSVQSELSTRQQLLREKTSQLREARSAALARRSLLEDLEIRQEGLGLGVKELLHRARHTHEAPWNTIVGSVSDLLDVDLEYAGLIEVALANRSQMIVLREYQPLLDYLNKGQVVLTGRVSFIALPERSPAQTPGTPFDQDRLIHLLPAAAPTLDLHDRPGVVMRADKLISSEHGIVGLAAALLSDTWIVQDLETAFGLALSCGPGVRFVTLQGELVDAQGHLQLGTIRNETSLLSRKSELRRIKNDLLRLERDVVTQESEIEILQRQAEAVDESLSLQKQQLDAFGDELNDAMAAWRTADQNAERARRELELLVGQRQAAEADLSRLQRLIEETEQSTANYREVLAVSEKEWETARQAVNMAMQVAQELDQQKSTERLDLFKMAERTETAQQNLTRLQEDLRQRILQTEEAERRVRASEAKREQIQLQMLNAGSRLAEECREIDRWQEMVLGYQRQKHSLRQQRSTYVEREQKIRRERRELQERQHADEIRSRELQQSLATMEERIQEEYQLSLADLADSEASAWQRWRETRPSAQSPSASDTAEAIGDEPGVEPAPQEPSPLILYDEREFAEVRPEIEAHVSRLRRKLKLLGSVNTDSLNDLEALEQRFVHLSTQLQDLVEARNTLDDIIRRMNLESRRLFTETFQVIRKNFQHLFRKVFGGGEGDIVLEDVEDVLECGIDITARPPGKELRSLSLLSGGEKTMAAIALIMAIFHAKPSPFCILDEVDAALDEANVDRFAGVLREFESTTQFIMITHHKRSMLVADVLYGVTMEESGVSKRMSVRFDDITDDGNFRRTTAA